VPRESVGREVRSTEIASLRSYVPPWMGLWFAVFPTYETMATQFLAAILVIGSYYAARRMSGIEPRKVSTVTSLRPTLIGLGRFILFLSIQQCPLTEQNHLGCRVQESGPRPAPVCAEIRKGSNWGCRRREIYVSDCYFGAFVRRIWVYR